MTNEISIIASNLCFQKDKKFLIKNVNLKIKKGKKTFIIGQNGSGKTILLKLLHGILTPSKGNIVYPRSIKQKMVFQKPILLRRTTHEHFNFVCPEFNSAKKIAWFKKSNLLNKLNLSARLLSGGEQQKLALIGALATNPDIIFLDEVTSNLDFDSKKFVENNIVEFSKNGKTIVMTSHSKLQAEKLADEIILISDGKIKECSSAKSFFSKPKSKEGKIFLENA